MGRFTSAEHPMDQPPTPPSPPAPPPAKDPRVAVNLRIKFRSENIDQFIERYAIDVSRGGIFIRTREPLSVGTQLKFDFQLQDTSPLMAGEGTVVWIREHDPSRAGVTPGMGVRFDKLTPASQPVLDKILTDKTRREQSGGNAAAPGTMSRAGAGMAVRRPSSTFSALDPAAIGIPSTGAPAPAGGGHASPPPPPTPATAGPTGSTLPFGVSTGGAGTSPPMARPLLSTTPGMPITPPINRIRTPPPVTSTPPPTPASSAGALPTSETQSALGKLATGPNLSSFGGEPSAPRTTASSSFALPRAPASPSPPAAPPTPPASNAAAAAVDNAAPAVPIEVEESEKTQIAEALPDFSNEPTRVGGPALPITDTTGSGRNAATITATSKRTPTPPPEPRLSLDQSVPAVADAAPAAAAPSDEPPSRTTAPSGTPSTVDRDAVTPKPRLSGSQPAIPQMPAPAAREQVGRPAPLVPRATAITARPPTPAKAKANAAAAKKRPTAFIIGGVLVGAIAAAVIGTQMTGQNSDAPAPPRIAATPPPPAPTPPPAPAPPVPPPAAAADPAAGAGTAAAPAKTDPVAVPNAEKAAATATNEAKTGEKPGEKTGEKPAEAKAAEAKAVKPAEEQPAPAVAANEPPPHAKAAPAPHRHAARRKSAAASPKAEASSDETAPAGAPGATGEGGTEPAAAAPAEAAAPPLAKITSTPSGAEVLIDGQTVGKTPYSGKDIDPAAPHALTVRKDGFETYEKMINASDWVRGKGNGQNLKVTVKLRKTRGAAGGDGTGTADKAAEPAGNEPAPEAPAAEPQ
jgi:uncharacterized protein (TIGR02266 family)